MNMIEKRRQMRGQGGFTLIELLGPYATNLGRRGRMLVT